MFRITRNHDELKNDYLVIWNDNSSDLENVRRLLRTYADSWNTSHASDIEWVLGLTNPTEMKDLIIQLCYKISEEKVTPRRGLDVIFEIIKDKTGLDVYSIYRAKKFENALSTLDLKMVAKLVTDNIVDLNKQYVFIDRAKPMTPLQYLLEGCVTSACDNFHPEDRISFITFTFNALQKFIEHSPSCLYQPIESYYEQLLLTANPKHTNTINHIGELLSTTLREQIVNFLCVANSLPIEDNLPKELVYYIISLTSQKFIHNTDKTGYYFITRLFMNYADSKPVYDPIRWSIKRAYDESRRYSSFNIEIFLTMLNFSHEFNKINYDTHPELNDIIRKIQKHTAINFSDYYDGSNLYKFVMDRFNRLPTTIKNTSIIQCILDNPKTFPKRADDITFLLSYPYFSNLYKNEAIKSLSTIIDTALSKDKFGSIRDLFNRSSCATEDYAFAPLSLLHRVLENINKPVDSFRLGLFLDSVNRINRKYDRSLITAGDTYNLLFEKKHLISNWESIEEKFIQCFVTDVHTFIKQLGNKKEAIQHFLITQASSSQQSESAELFKIALKKLYKETAISIFCLAHQINPSDEVATNLHHMIEVIASQCKANDVLVSYQFMKTIAEQSFMLLSIKKIPPNDRLSHLLNLGFKTDIEPYFSKVGTFFGGRKKYDETSNSPVAELTDPIVQKIAEMTVKAMI